MRISPIPSSVIHPEGAAGVRPVAGAGAPGPAEVSRDNRQPSPPPESQTMRYEAVQERRQFVRRGEERRKRQVPVLLDTRVGPRRTERRRDEDATPGNVDLEA
jgi:hypothetical protein